MLLERLRRIDDEFLLLNTANEARRFVGLTGIVDVAFVSLLPMLLVVLEREKQNLLDFLLHGAGNCVVFRRESNCYML